MDIKSRAAFKFRRGEFVTVKSVARILETLDHDGKLEGLPFTAEMAQFCGRVLTVRTRVNRINVEGVGVRGIKNVVILSQGRCDGSAHNGCERACSLLFKEAWLQKADPAEISRRNEEPRPAPKETPLPFHGAMQPCHGQGPVLVAATAPLPIRDIRQYIDDLRFKTYGVREVAAMLLLLLNRKCSPRDEVSRVASREKTVGTLAWLSLHILRQNSDLIIHRVARNLFRRKPEMTQTPQLPPIPAPKPRSSSPAFQPGDLVEVRTREEILSTLDPEEKLYGLGFAGSMLTFCGQRFRVAAPVTRLIDEKAGREGLRIKNTYTLDGVFCDGVGYRGCPGPASGCGGRNGSGKLINRRGQPAQALLQNLLKKLSQNEIDKSPASVPNDHRAGLIVFENEVTKPFIAVSSRDRWHGKKQKSAGRKWK